jgi:hypothetical protein
MVPLSLHDNVKQYAEYDLIKKAHVRVALRHTPQVLFELSGLL